MKAMPLPTSQDASVQQYTSDYMRFIEQSPTSFHAAQRAAEILEETGFQQVRDSGPYPTEPGGYYLRKAGAIVAWVMPREGSGFSIVGSHTDSPGFKLKPVPQSTTVDGWGQLLVEVYGGPLYSSWLDRELSLAGVVMDQAGSVHLVQTGPLARIPQLAPHLDRTQNSKGLVLDAQEHMQPIWLVDQEESVMAVVAKSAGLDGPSDILASELFLVPTEKPGLFGPTNQFLASYRQDNLSSTYAALSALVRAYDRLWDSTGGNQDWPTGQVPVFVSFDHEEVGSASPTGARSDLLPSVLRRLAEALGGKGEEVYGQMLAASSLISADAGHSVHPNYASKIDPDTRPVMGRGPILKIDADQRYATSVEGIGLWNLVCAASKVPTQQYVTKSSMRSGSTIGPALATMLGVVAVDVGIAMISMHSAREMGHVVDTFLLSQALEGYWTNSVALTGQGW